MAHEDAEESRRRGRGSSHRRRSANALDLDQSRVEADFVDQLFNSSEKRLARLLLLLANFGKEGKPEPVIAKISQETLAEMIGTTRSRVSFFMNKFWQLGFIDYNGGIAVHSSLLNVVLHDQPQIYSPDCALAFFGPRHRAADSKIAGHLDRSGPRLSGDDARVSSDVSNSAQFLLQTGVYFNFGEIRRPPLPNGAIRILPNG